MTAYDVIVVGAGHNGLTAAAYLARAGKRLLVLERRSTIGGSVATESFGAGFQADAVWPGGTLRPDIVKHLNLQQFGYPAPGPKPAFVSLLPEFDAVVLDADPLKAAQSIKRFSDTDAGRWPDFVAFMDKSAGILDLAYATIMPRLPKHFGVAEGYGLLELGLDLRLAGREFMLRFLRALAMTAQELLEEWFQSQELKGALASLGVHGGALGPMAAGTGYTLVHNWLNRGGLSHPNCGRAGEITGSLAEAVKSAGGEIRIDAPVERIDVDTYTCKGVTLSSGEEIRAGSVISALDPKRTFLSLVGPLNLPPEFVWKTQSMKMHGSVAKVHLLTNGRHGLPDSTLVIAPSTVYLERAHDTAKYGGISEQPYLEVTTSGNVVSVHLQYAPYALKGVKWDDQRTPLEELVINTLAAHFPNLKSSITDRRSLTPPDLESIYGLTEGDLNHGQLMLDQFLFMRPLPGWSNHKTPIDNLYLCGGGVHAGGGVSGASGRNAAHVVLKNSK